MTERMRALVKTASGEGNLELRDVPVPEIGPGDVLLEIAYCGVCGSDLHIEAGTHPSEPPVVLGHEYSGTVAAVGEEVTGFALGDEVAFRRGWNPFPGVGSDGGFAEYMRAPADTLWPLPDGVSLEAATQFETVTTPMALVHDTAELKPGEDIVVSGPGPIGLLLTAVARAAGASSITVLGTDDDTDRRLPTAEHLGADRTLVFGEEALATVDEDPPGVWFETSGAAPAIEAAVEHVAGGGTVVCSGLGEGPWDVDMKRVAYRNLEIQGKWGGNDDYLEPAVAAMQRGDLDVSAIVTDTVPLTDWREGFDLVRSQSGIKVLLDPSR
jgi:2-desacetyl-2-hydroxyethyl bacteriochlorophyllide A dehydrogenase